MSKNIDKNKDAEDYHIEKFVTFMKNHFNKKDKSGNYKNPTTHTLMDFLHEKKAPHMGSFYVSNVEYDRFLKLYKNVYGLIPLSIVERHNNSGKMVGPFIIDIDYKTTCDERLYTLDHIKKIATIASSAFLKFFDVDSDMVKAYVLEKDSPTYDPKNKNYKDGFHIHYNLPISYNKRKFLYDIIKKKIVDNRIFDDIDHESSYDEIVDECVLKDNGVLMYGSRKPKRKPYEMTYVFDHEINEEDIDDYETDELINIFSLRQYNDTDDIEFKDKYSEQEEILSDPEYYTKDKKEKKDKTETPDKKKNADGFKYSPIGSYPLDKLPSEYAILKDLLDIMSVKRATEYDGWIRVGWALHGVSPRLYNLFAYFSKKAPNFDEYGCFQVWNKANREKSGLTIASLNMWAKQDDPDGYQQIRYARLQELIIKIENPNHDDIANVIVEMYKDIYKCVSIKGNSWYEFQDHRWVPVDSAYTLQEKIASEVTKEFDGLGGYFFSNKDKGDGFDRDNKRNQLMKLFATIQKLKDQNYGATLIKTCARKMYDSKFEESLNSNPYLIGFENGVYDLKTMSFREGVPDDRLTLSTNYDYIDFEEDDPLISEIEDFLYKLQPKEHIREYVMRLFASFLDGRNKDQQFRLFTGSGSNGKSKLIDLLDITMGKYSGALPSEVLTVRNNNPNGATPYLADKMGMRFLVIQEPEGDATIQVGKMKGLTGGDAVPARKLFGDPFTYRPQFKIILVCNKKPKIPADDGGTWRRIRDVQFKSKFVGRDKVNEDKHHYLRDETIDEKLVDWAPAFMWMLINQYYPKYIKNPKEGGGLQEPEEVTAASEQYRKDSDVFHEFLAEMVKFTGDEDHEERVVDLFNMFREWHRDNYNHNTKFARKDLEEYLDEKKGWKCEKGIITGIKVLFGDNDDDIDDDKKKKKK